ncbi:MAG: replication factor C large subunit [Candidatus Nanoarchaeia archaeon]
MNPWTEQYRPTKFDEIKGQPNAVEKVKEFVYNFKKNPRAKKALILHGPPGTGKTTLAHVVAGETNSEIFELNASDLRNKFKLQEILKPAFEQKSLAKQSKIILVDEVDGISATDRGGLNELIALIGQTSYPVIITANDIWNKKFSPLRKKAELVHIKEVDYKTMKDVMIQILKKENLFMNQNILTSIAARAKGDLRAAINDLQTASRLQDPSQITFHERNKEIDIFNALKQVFQGKPSKHTLELYDSVNMQIDEIILWVEENIPKEYHGEELARAYELLSKVDLFKGRIYKQQYWRFLIYENFFLSYGISSSKKSLKTGFKSYKKPTRILKIWLNNQRTMKKKSIAQKYARYVHVGEKRAMSEFPIIRHVLKSHPKIASELKLTREEIDYLKN